MIDLNGPQVWAISPTAAAHVAPKLDALRAAILARPGEALENNSRADAIQAAATTVDELAREDRAIRRDGATAIISINGAIIKSAGFWAEVFGFTGLRQARNRIAVALADDNIEAITLSIDSPGGSVDGLPEFGDYLRQAAQVKPIESTTDGMIASAAYYIASQTAHISATRMSNIGSIGVRMALYDLSEHYESYGIKVIPIDTGEFKSAGLEGTKITEDQIQYFQGVVNAYFEDFASVVMAGRSMSRASFDAVADGRVFFGSFALERGLIDSIRTDKLQQSATGRSTQNARRKLALNQI